MVEPKPPQRPENSDRQNAQVHAGNDQQMVRSRTLKLGARGIVQKRFFAEHHGIHERRLWSRPKLMNLGNDAGVHARSPKHDAIAGKSRQSFDIRHRSRTEQADAAIPKISLVVECPGIVKISGLVQLGADAKSFAVSKVRRWNG